MEYYFTGWTKLARERGMDFPKDKFMALAGSPFKDIAKAMFIYNGREIDEEMIGLFLQHKKACFKQERDKGNYPSEITSVTQIVKSNHGLKMAVASSGNKEDVLRDLKKHGLADYFSAVVTVDDVKNGKPEPDIFIKAAEQLGIDRNLCLGYEDATLGIKALKRAKIDAVNVMKFYDYPN